MKTLLLKTLFIALITMGLNGCYTIIWSPDSELPTEDNSVTSAYYGDTYYGEYYYFYDTPWWWEYNYTPAAASTERGNETAPVRDLGGRGTPTGPVIIETAPPTRDINPPSTGSSGNTGNRGTSTETTRSSSTSNSGSASRESSSSGSSVRNNNGERSSGGRR